LIKSPVDIGDKIEYFSFAYFLSLGVAVISSKYPAANTDGFRPATGHYGNALIAFCQIVWRGLKGESL
jgi:hypothetical protein